MKKVWMLILVSILIDFVHAQTPVELKKFTLQSGSYGVSKIIYGFENGTPVFAVQTPERYEEQVSTYKVQVFDWETRNRRFVKDTYLTNDQNDYGPIWNTAMIFCDLNSDGMDELYLRQKLSGTTYLIGYNSITGAEITRIAWPLPINKRNDQHLLSCAYLDGIENNPSIIIIEGNYETRLFIYDLISGSFVLRQSILYPGDGMGGHGFWAGDYDGDGKDEMLSGDNLLDDDGSLLWSAGLGHVDIMLPAELNSESTGPEFVFGTCDPGTNLNGKGIFVYSLAGNLLWDYTDSDDSYIYHMHGGWVASVSGDTIPEIWAHTQVPGQDSRPYLFNAAGDVLNNDWITNTWPLVWNDDNKYEYCIQTGSGITTLSLRTYPLGSGYPPSNQIYPFNCTAEPGFGDVCGNMLDEIFTTDDNYLRVWNNTAGNPPFTTGRFNHNYRMMAMMPGSGYYRNKTPLFVNLLPSFMDTVNQCMSDSLPEFTVSGHAGLTISVSKVVPYNYSGEIVWNYDCSLFIQAVKASYVNFLDGKIQECVINIQFWSDAQDSIEVEQNKYD